jgi:hypothetical protein
MDRGKKISTTVYLTEQQVAAIDKLHQITHISKSQLFRMGVDDLLVKYKETLKLEPSATPKLIDPADSNKFLIGDQKAVIA